MMTVGSFAMPALDRRHVEAWARQRLLEVEVVQSLPKAVQKDFLKSLVQAYAAGYRAAVREMASLDDEAASLTSEGD